MKSLAPVVLLLLPLAAASIAFGGGTGAGAVMIGGALLAVVGAVLVRGEERARVAGRSLRAERVTRFLVLLVVAGFVCRVLLAVTLRSLDLNAVIGGDEETFHRNGIFFEAWLDGRTRQPFQSRWVGTSQVGYFAFIGTCYWLFGQIQIVPILVNCLIGALCAIPVYRTAARLGGDVAGRAAAVLVTFFPSLVLWSCLMVRDVIVFFLLAWCACLGQELLRRIDVRRLAFLVVVLALLATLRTYIFLVIGGALVAAFASSLFRRPGRAFVVATASLLAVAVLVRGAGLGAEFLDAGILEQIDHQRRLNGLAGNTAIELGSHDVSTPTGALAYLPIGLAYFVLAPFPWEMGGRQLLALPDILVWYACIPLLVLGSVEAVRRCRTLAAVPLIAGVAVAVLYGLLEGNVGIIVRHRAQMFVLLVPFVGLAVARLLRRHARRDAAQQAARARIVGPRASPPRRRAPVGAP